MRIEQQHNSKMHKDEDTKRNPKNLKRTSRKTRMRMCATASFVLRIFVPP